MQSEPDPKTSPPPAPYQTPRLVRFGSVADLTQRRWTGGMMDNGNGGMNRTA